MTAAQDYHQKTEEFRQKIRSAIRESRVDDWVADRMTYVVDYLDTLLLGFFTFQNVMMERFGDGGQFVTDQLKAELFKGLQHASQQHNEIMAETQKAFEKWVQDAGNIQHSVDEAIQKMPELWAAKRFEQALIEGFPIALKWFDEKIAADPAFREEVARNWGNQAITTMSEMLSSVAKLTDDEGKSVFLNEFRALWRKQVLDTFNAAEMQTLLKEGLQPVFAALGKDTQGLRDMLTKGMIEPLLKHLQTQLESVTEETVAKLIEGSVRKILAAELSGDELRKNLQGTVGDAIQAHMVANPLSKPLGQYINPLTQKVREAQEQLDGLRECLDQHGELLKRLSASMTEPSSTGQEAATSLSAQELIERLNNQDVSMAAVAVSLDNHGKILQAMHSVIMGLKIK